MPGIVGLVTRRPPEEAERQLTRMVDALRHGPAYRTGTWCDRASGIYVGWSVLSNSFADGMPLTNEHGTIVLLFAGEEFPEPGTIDRLRRRGHEVEATGCAYLPHLYEEDRSFPSGLNGRFHGLLVDRARGMAMLFNDRYGMRRLYYHSSADTFYFAAEAKAILAVRPELRRLDPRGLGEVVACGCVMENRTLFPGIEVLPAASAWTFTDGAPAARTTYFHPRDWEQQEPLEPDAFAGEIRDVFSRNLPRYFNGRQPIAMSLTGGLDTRTIMAWHKPAPGSLPCYTFGGMFHECRDVSVARQVARVCRQPHSVISVGAGFLARFADYAERTVYLTDGCADVCRAPDLYVNEQAREIAPVRATGNYGGEVLRRVRAFKPISPASGLFCGELTSSVDAASDTYRNIIQGHPLSFAVFRQAPWHHHGLLALEETQLSLRSPYLDNDFVRTVFRAPQAAVTSNDVCLRLIAEGNRALADIPTDRGTGGAYGRIWSAASRAIQEFQFKAEYAYDYGMPQWVASIDHALENLRLERLFLGRHKFYHFRIWYRDALARYVRDMLLDPRALARPYLIRSRVESIVDNHLQGKRNYTATIHKLITLELVHRLFVDAT